ncbi:MAG: AmmeMemoRadiSam system protein B [Acidobacteriota bacterium]|nr:AmmeMemoRadiSam system protein B [Acidobacteriota bacterium]
MVRKPAFTGTWYPGRADALAFEVDAHVAAADPPPLAGLGAIITPHAGLMFSGAAAAWSWKAAARACPDLIVLVGPSHYVGFDGVSVWPAGAFDTPLGPIGVDADAAAQLLAGMGTGLRDRETGPPETCPPAHVREHSLEMQLPFIRRLMPSARLLPIVMGWQRPETIAALAEALAATCDGRRALLAASTDLSHFFPVAEAARLDGETIANVERLDTGGLLAQLARYPDGEAGRFVACGAGPMISVLMAARAMGGARAHTLSYAHSGQISGDHASVVGYLSAAVTGAHT